MSSATVWMELSRTTAPSQCPVISSTARAAVTSTAQAAAAAPRIHTKRRQGAAMFHARSGLMDARRDIDPFLASVDRAVEFTPHRSIVELDGNQLHAERGRVPFDRNVRSEDDATVGRKIDMTNHHGVR